jgi:hypothetical protein
MNSKSKKGGSLFSGMSIKRKKKKKDKKKEKKEEVTQPEQKTESQINPISEGIFEHLFPCKDEPGEERI